MNHVFMETKNLSREQKQQIIDIWNSEYPAKLSHTDLDSFEQYLQGLADKHHIILSDEQGTVKGWLVYFIRDDKRCFAMLLDASVQGRGWGSKFLDLAKKHNAELNGWVVDHNRELKQNGEPYRSPVGFYEKNEFQILSDTPVTFDDIDIGGIRITWTK